MKQITVKINEKVYDKVVWFLQQFKNSDVEIIDNDFKPLQKEVENDFNEARKPNAKFYSLEEADLILEEAIAKYENNSK